MYRVKGGEGLGFISGVIVGFWGLGSSDLGVKVFGLLLHRVLS